MLDAAIALASGQNDHQPDLLPDLPTGGIVDLRTLGALRHGQRARVRVLARVKQHSDESTGRSRLLIDELPWPLTTAEVDGRLRTLVIDGALEGVVSITSTSSVVVLEFAHLAWARRAARALSFAALGREQGPLQVTFEAQVRAEGAMSPRQYLESFVAAERQRLRAPVEAPVMPTSSELANAEALAVALTLLDDVQAALRPTIDLTEEVQALMTFMTRLGSDRRALLIPLGTLTHSYERGFTEAQAKWLTSGKRLTSRSAALAKRDFEALRETLNVRLPWRQVLEAVPLRLALERAKQRFGRARRTTVDRLPEA